MEIEATAIPAAPGKVYYHITGIIDERRWAARKTVRRKVPPKVRWRMCLLQLISIYRLTPGLRYTELSGRMMNGPSAGLGMTSRMFNHNRTGGNNNVAMTVGINARILKPVGGITTNWRLRQRPE